MSFLQSRYSVLPQILSAKEQKTLLFMSPYLSENYNFVANFYIF